MKIRKLALDTIEKIMEKKAFASIALNDALKENILSKEDKALFTNIVYGTIQHLLTIDYFLFPYIGHKKQKAWIKYLLDLSIYQLHYLQIPDYAVLNEAVEIAKEKDRAIGSFVNAVLRNFLRNPLRSFADLNPVESLSIRYSHPLWLVESLLKDYDYETVEKILIENSLVKSDAYRINTLKTDKETVYDILEEEGIAYRNIEFVKNGFTAEVPLISHHLFKNGFITVQDASAQYVSEVTNPKPNSMVLDACSAPGGKATHLSALMKNTGVITACDIHPHKLKLMNNLFQRMGSKNISLELTDARLLKDKIPAETYDTILSDVPCSGFGVLSHKPDLRYRIDPDSIKEIKELQKEILESTWGLLKRGGTYTYSTCTINKDENERQISEFLKTHNDAEVIFEKTILPYMYKSDGFYICVLRRNELGNEKTRNL